MNDHPLALFINLVERDRLAKRLTHQYQTGTDQITLLQSEKQSYAQAVEDAEKALQNAQKDVELQEKTMSSLDRQLVVTNKKLDEISSSKELLSLTKEKEALYATQSVQEAKVLDTWKALEKNQELFLLLKNQLHEKLSALDIIIQKKQRELDALTVELQEGALIRQQLVARVNDEWLKKYNRMLLSADDPVVPVVRGQCGGCSHMVTAQEAVRLDHKALIECKNCFRLLYLPEKMQGYMATDNV